MVFLALVPFRKFYFVWDVFKLKCCSSNTSSKRAKWSLKLENNTFFFQINWPIEQHITAVTEWPNDAKDVRLIAPTYSFLMKSYNWADRLITTVFQVSAIITVIMLLIHQNVTLTRLVLFKTPTLFCHLKYSDSWHSESKGSL